MNENGLNGSRLAALGGGIIITLLGLIFLLDNFYNFLSVGLLWPLFMLIPAIPLGLAWAEKGKAAAAVVVPITILVFYSAYFLWLNYTSWAYSATTWPNYLIGPGLGLLFLYLIKRKGGLLVAAFILLGLAALFLWNHL
ncbi:MAG: hypothetical protein WCL37_01975 [Chrysiogenales bacterium]